jgi:hypothetical protein
MGTLPAAEEIGLDDGVTALGQLGLIPTAAIVGF